MLSKSSVATCLLAASLMAAPASALAGNPFPGIPRQYDFDGDGKADFGVYGTNGPFATLLSTAGYNEGVQIDVSNFGNTSFIPHESPAIIKAARAGRP